MEESISSKTDYAIAVLLIQILFIGRLQNIKKQLVVRFSIITQ